ncbi:hypothetical protein AVEN_271741-1 [Araneus ventricosus]|uniref:Transmembrane protein n=1 Tax=Araneus ventricosus TaxID=182803 RepID=A0A4Y2SS81_ARAVE|nr:hypothetical protein AVEN_176898-1 [Araneus ventricosus]GBN90306.1 hypothetical protein AVEN_271741-1 [Araneus ventricosus]
MEVIVSNIPARFRGSLELRREDYQQINDGPQPTLITKTSIVVFLACLAICIAGLITYAWGYTTVGTAALFSVPVSCALYLFLRCLDWSRYFGCLSGICGCRTAEIPTPELPSPFQPLLQPPTLQQPVSEPLTEV